MTKQIISQAELKQILHYEPLTGLFTRISLVRGCRLGSIAGCPVTGGKGYQTITINNKKYLSHRLAWFYIYNEWPDQVDHDNRIRSDNRLVNLRKSKSSINNKNASLRTDNTSGIVGVAWRDYYNRYHVTIGINGKVKYLGLYCDLFSAVCARKSAEYKYGFHKNHGDSARKSDIQVSHRLSYR